MSTKLSLSLDLPPNLANERMHWRTKHKRRKNYLEACDNRQLLGLVPPPPAEPFVGVAVSALFRVHNIQDWDNLHARLKWALDWLVSRGYLLDDSPEVIPVCPHVQQILDRQKKGLVIELDGA